MVYHEYIGALDDFGMNAVCLQLNPKLIKMLHSYSIFLKSSILFGPCLIVPETTKNDLN